MDEPSVELEANPGQARKPAQENQNNKQRILCNCLCEHSANTLLFFYTGISKIMTGVAAQNVAVILILNVEVSLLTKVENTLEALETILHSSTK